MFRTNSARLALLLGLSAVVAGCTSAPPDRMFGLPASGAAQLDVCHGFNCYFRTKVAFGGDDAALIACYFAAEGDLRPEVAVEALAHVELRRAGRLQAEHAVRRSGRAARDDRRKA